MNTPVQAGPKAGRRFWQTHLKALATSGFSRSEYCRRHNLSSHALTYWVCKQQEITPVKPALSLIEVPVRSSLPLRSGAAALRVYLAAGVTDMRKSIDTLAVLVSERLDLDPLSGHLFGFCNRKRDTIKILYWDRNGFCLWHKRLERDRFHWPDSESEARLLTAREFK